MRTRVFESVARVEFHLSGGFSRIVLEDLYYDGSEPRYEIPTEIIPAESRLIGSRFQLSGAYPDPNGSPEEIRATLRSWAARPIA